MKSSATTGSRTAAFLFALASSALAQDPSGTPKQDPAPAPPATTNERREIERLIAWPKLGSEALKTVRTDIERVRKARTPEMADQAQAALVAAGAGAAPELIPVLGKEEDRAALARIQAVLEQITAAEHTRLLAAEFTDKLIPVRTWCMKRVARFPDAGVRALADAALARVQKQGEKGDREERYAAALCATSAGSHEGLETLASWAFEGWGKRGEEMRPALEAVRGPEASQAVFALMGTEDRKRIVGGLNMLAGCGDLDSAAKVRPYLDSDDNSIRVAAINAMRGIIDGEQPIANLPVFEAIELAKKWKGR